MKNLRLIWAPAVFCLSVVSCDKPKPAGSAEDRQGADDLAAERAAIEDEWMALERERLEEERAALEEEKEALRAEREARLAAREDEVDWRDESLEERQAELEAREAELSGREDDLAEREGGLSERELELAGLEALDAWEPEPVADFQEPVADFGTFYDDLQPYGSWFETPDYGYVYQPTVVVRDSSWRPYTRGRWACSDQGWAWISDEPFGWACFHYGRWALLGGRGWVWVPGDEWAPSWVCWREGGDHVGWAPLPPETLGFRGRGWDSSVEADFGIGSAWFSFVKRRHMADPPWRHCLPVERNRECIRDSRNITRIQFRNNRVIAGGPRYDALRRAVARPWPVYRIQKDRLHALRHPKQRGTTIHGNHLEVFAPNLGTRWNGALRPSRIAGRWDDVRVVRAEGGIKKEWAERFRENRRERNEQAAAWDGRRDELSSARRKLAENREKVAAAQRKIQAKQQEMPEARKEKLARQRRAKRDDAPGSPGDGERQRPTLAERQRQAAERLRLERDRPAGSETPARGGDGRNTAGTTNRDRGAVDGEASRQSGVNRGPTRRPQPQIDETAARREQARNESEERDRGGRMREALREQQEAAREKTEARRLQQQRQAEEKERQQAEEAAARQERAKNESDERNRGERMREALRKQQEAARDQAEELRQKQQQAEETRRRQRDEANARKAQEENAKLQQQEQQREAMRQRAQEQARQQQEERARQQAEAARRQQEEQARQQQRMREQQEERAREQAERARQQQEKRARQQEERAREQAERAQRQEEARRQQEERARQQQEEQARRQEENARRQDQGEGGGRRRGR